MRPLKLQTYRSIDVKSPLAVHAWQGFGATKKPEILMDNMKNKKGGIFERFYTRFFWVSKSVVKTPIEKNWKECDCEGNIKNVAYT